MSWGVKYRLDIKQRFTQTIWRVDFLVDGYAGSVNLMEGAGDPVQIGTVGTASDDPWGIVAKEAVIRVYSTTNFQYLNMILAASGRDYKVKIYKNTSTLMFEGWMDPDYYSEDFLPPKYPVQFHVNDGLGELKNKYISLPSTPSTFDKTLIWYISEALQQTGINLDIYATLDLQFTHSDGEAGSITGRLLENIYVDYRVWRQGNNTWENYYNILDKILKSLQLRLFQEQGVWWVERVLQKKTLHSVEKYDYQGSYDSSADWSSIKELTANNTPYIIRFLDSSATLEVIPAFKKFNIKQDYGHKESILKSHNMDGFFYPDDWEDMYDLLYWTRNGDGGMVKYITIHREDELSPGAVRLGGFNNWDPTSGAWNAYILSNDVFIEGSERIEKLLEVWTGYKDKDLYVETECFVKKERVDPNDTYRIYVQVYLQDSDGNEWFSDQTDIEGRGMFSDDGSSRLEKDIKANDWTTVKWKMNPPRTHGLYQPSWLKINVKIYTCWTTEDPASWEAGSGIVLKTFKLGFLDGSSNFNRTISNTINEDHRHVPSDYEFELGETPGHWGDESPKYGQEQMDRFIFKDSDGIMISEWGTEDAGMMGGLLSTVARTFIQSQHQLPMLRLSGLLSDRKGSMDFTRVLQDYSGNKYYPVQFQHNIAECDIQVQYIQIFEPNEGDSGEFNWDFGNDFNI